MRTMRDFVGKTSVGPLSKAIRSTILIGAVALAGPCLAESPADDGDPESDGPKAVPGGDEVKGPQGDRPARRGDMREKMLEKFDKDQDGRLSDEEREALQDFLQKRRAEQGDRFGRGGESRRGPEAGGSHGGRGRPHGHGFGGQGQAGPHAGRPHEGRPPRDRREHRGFGGDRPRHLGQVRGLQGGGGHGGSPDLGKLFDRLDQDGDGKLDRKEFKAGMKRLRKMHRPDHASRARGGSDGSRFHGDKRPHPDRRFGGHGKKDKPGGAHPRKPQRPEGRPEDPKPVEQEAADPPADE